MIAKIKSALVPFSITVVNIGVLLIMLLGLRAGVEAQQSSRLVIQAADLVTNQMILDGDDFMKQIESGNQLVYGIPVVLGGQPASPVGPYVSVMHFGNSVFLNGFNRKHELILHRVLG